MKDVLSAHWIKKPQQFNFEIHNEETKQTHRANETNRQESLKHSG